MSSTLKLREDAILPFTPATDLTEYRGYGVTIAGELCTLGASATVKQKGIILEGSDVDGQTMVAILGAVSGGLPVKLGGVVTKGDSLQQGADGRWVTDAGAGARIVSLVALESGIANEIIEAAGQNWSKDLQKVSDIAYRKLAIT